MKTKGSRNKKGVSRILNYQGYYEIFEPKHPLAKRNGYVREHRKIVYDTGVLTDLRMEVHHKNGVKTDNRLENLEVMSKWRHTSVTWKGRKQPKWTKERRKAVSERMKGNKNWKGDIYSNPSLISDKK